VLAAVGALAGPLPKAAAAAAPDPPHVKAKAFVIIDTETGYVLAGLNPDLRLPMASTTKIMTGLLVLEHVKNLKAKVVAKKDAVSVGESEIWLEPGEKLTVDQMLRALLVSSANDASLALADYVAGDEKKFVALMNARAAELGLTNTHFTNPHGLDESGHYSSARDLAVLARVAMLDKRFRDYVNDYTYEIPWKGHPWPRLLTSHNTLLQRFDWVDGVKTGWTDPAGYCIVISGEYGGRRFIVALLGEPRAELRETDGEKLFTFAASLYGERELCAAGVPAAHVTVPYHDEGTDLVISEPLTASVRRGAEVTATVEADTSAALPLAEGQAMGTIVFAADGVEIGRRELVTEDGFPEAGWSTRLRYRAHGAWDWVTSIF
jgi:D-alanyl-D-alanine carboxypeptidase (penicillin-binding protein 5/6)